MPNTYMQIFRTRQEQSTSLQDPAYRKYLMDKGFLWVRPLVRPWRNTLREPTLGRLVEVVTCECRGAVPIQSPAGERIIWRLCGL
jgi:hypothetical protein